MRKRSLKLNMVLNTIKGLMTILFPLITYPYVTKILGVENLGRYSFASSIISYFILISGLGIETYAIREGARIREDKFEQFANEIFSFNVISTIVSYGLLIILLFTLPKFNEYFILLSILSAKITFQTIGISWIYSIYEDYLYLAINSIIFQIISLILLFIFVNNESDLNIYAVICVIASGGANLINYFYSKKYCKVKFVKEINWSQHFKPVMILFAMSATITIYVSSDITILGFMCGDYTVGIYSVATKFYTVVKQILSAILVVSIPRLSSLLGKQKKAEFRIVASDIYKTLCTLLFPAITGMIIMRNEIITIISNESYIEATSSYSILCIALIFCMLAWFWGQCILIPLKKEIDVFKATIVSAIINIILNFILIPIYKENAAAFTTVLSQAIAFIWCWRIGRRAVKIYGTLICFLKILAGCFGIYLCSLLLGFFIDSIIIYVIFMLIISTIVYFGVEILLRNEAIGDIIGLFNKKNGIC